MRCCGNRKNFLILPRSWIDWRNDIEWLTELFKGCEFLTPPPNLNEQFIFNLKNQTREHTKMQWSTIKMDIYKNQSRVEKCFEHERERDTYKIMHKFVWDKLWESCRFKIWSENCPAWNSMKNAKQMFTI